MSQFSIQRILTLNRLSQKAWQVQKADIAGEEMFVEDILGLNMR